MERLMRSLRILWRSERIIAERQIRLGTQRVQFNVLTAFIAVFGLVMLSISAFFALVPYWGQALAALGVAVGDFVLAAGMAAYGSRLKTPTEIEMVKEVRDMALNDLEEEMTLAEAELVSMKEDVQKFIRNPVDALLPGMIGPILNAVARGLGASKK
ncbi:MAG: phage holin family protein [Gammaproteobacteria bacterium]